MKFEYKLHMAYHLYTVYERAIVGFGDCCRQAVLKENPSSVRVCFYPKPSWPMAKYLFALESSSCGRILLPHYEGSCSLPVYALDFRLSELFINAPPSGISD